MAIIPGAENIDWMGTFSGVMYWVKMFFYSLIMGVFFIVAYFMTTYRIKATVYPLYGSGKDGIFSVQRPKKNYFTWKKNRTAWKPLFPLMNNKEIEPFDQEYIYPGNRIIAFDLNGEYIPGRVNINRGEDKIRAEINPVPYYIRNWQSLQYKKNAIEYADHTFWNDNKSLIAALIASFAILAAGRIFVYLTYKMAGAGSKDISALTEAIKGFGNIPAGDAIPK